MPCSIHIHVRVRVQVKQSNQSIKKRTRVSTTRADTQLHPYLTSTSPSTIIYTRFCRSNHLSGDTNNLGDLLSRCRRVAAIRKMRAGAASRTREIADLIITLAVTNDLTVINAFEALTIVWVSECSDSSDLGTVESVQSCVNDHGTLRISAQNDLGVWTLRECLLRKFGHGCAAVTTAVGIALQTC